MALTVLFFGQLTELAGCEKTSLPLIADTDRLKQELWSRYPRLRNIRYAIAVDRRIVRENTALPEQAEIGILPPFSGG